MESFRSWVKKVDRKEMRAAGKMDKYRRDIMMKSSRGLHQNAQDDPEDFYNLTTSILFHYG